MKKNIKPEEQNKKRIQPVSLSSSLYKYIYKNIKNKKKEVAHQGGKCEEKEDGFCLYNSEEKRRNTYQNLFSRSMESSLTFGIFLVKTLLFKPLQLKGKGLCGHFWVVLSHISLKYIPGCVKPFFYTK